MTTTLSSYLTALSLAVVLSRLPMPYVYAAGVPQGRLPSGILLCSLPVLGISFLWRDVTSPVSATFSDPVKDRLPLVMWTALASSAGALVIMLVLRDRLFAPTVISSALFFVGFLGAVSAIIGVRAAAAVVSAFVLAWFTVAPVSDILTAPLLPANWVGSLLAGILWAVVGTTAVLLRGHDPARLASGRMTGINDN